MTENLSESGFRWIVGGVIAGLFAIVMGIIGFLGWLLISDNVRQFDKAEKEIEELGIDEKQLAAQVSETHADIKNLAYSYAELTKQFGEMARQMQSAQQLQQQQWQERNKR